jgi:hypothetical protein
MSEDRTDQTGVVIPNEVLIAARDRRPRANNSASPGGAQHNRQSTKDRRCRHGKGLPFKPGQFADRQATADGQTEAFVVSWVILFEAVEAARILTPLQFLHLWMEIGRVLQPGFAVREERLAPPCRSFTPIRVSA